MKLRLFSILLGWCVASGAVADHKFKQLSSDAWRVAKYPGTNIIGNPFYFDLRKVGGTWTFQNQSAVVHTPDLIRKQNKIREAQVDRLNSALHREWGRIYYEQLATRITLRMLLTSSALLGVCSEELENIRLDETWVFTFEPYSELSDQELRKELIKVNKDISTIREGILADIISSDGENKVKDLNTKMTDSWKALLNDSDVRAKGIDRLFMQYQSWDDYLLNIVLNDKSGERITKYFETLAGIKNFIKMDEIVEKFSKASGKILLNNMDQYQERLSQLQDLCESSVKIRALIAARLAKQISEPHSHCGENCHIEATKGQQQGQ